MSQSLYDVLGVKSSASDAEITRAYRKLAKTCHPDLHPGDKKAEERFKQLSGAYDILSDVGKRARYDRGEIDEEGRERAFANGFRSSSTGPGGMRFEFGTSGGTGSFGFEDILGDLFGGGGGAGRRRRSRSSFFDGMAGGGASAASADVQLEVTVGFVEAARGGVQRLHMPDGSTLDLTIPEGTTDGQVLRLKGKGQPGPSGQPGDALITVRVPIHPTFKRDGNNVLVDQPVPLSTAVLGGKVRVPTLDGEVNLSVPKGSSSGRTLRLKGKGIRDPRTGQTGDQLVRVLVEIPEDHELQSLLERWAERQPVRG